MELIILILLTILLAVLLAKSADLAENAFVFVAHKLKLNPFFIGFGVLGIAATLPEISVVFASVAEERPDLSIGNALGGSAVLLSVILGGAIIKYRKLSLGREFALSDLLLVLAIVCIKLFALADGSISQLDGVMILVMYAFITWFISRGKTHAIAIEQFTHGGKLQRLLLASVLGVVGLLVFSRLLVIVAIHMADLLALPGNVVGIFILSLGTNLPELTILLRSKGYEKEELALGAILGSVAAHSVVVGLMGVFNPYALGSFATLEPVMLYTVAMVLLVLALAFTGRKLTFREGILLALTYLVFAGWQGIVLASA